MEKKKKNQNSSVWVEFLNIILAPVAPVKKKQNFFSFVPPYHTSSLYVFIKFIRRFFFFFLFKEKLSLFLLSFSFILMASISIFKTKQFIHFLSHLFIHSFKLSQPFSLRWRHYCRCQKEKLKREKKSRKKFSTILLFYCLEEMKATEKRTTNNKNSFSLNPKKKKEKRK